MADTRATLTAKALLDAVVGGYETAGVDLPERQLVALGLPAWDCEQLTVSIERIYAHGGDVNIEAPTVTHAHPGFLMRAAVMSVLLLRCVPTSDDSGTPPAAEDEQAGALAVYADQQLVENAIIDAYNAGRGRSPGTLRDSIVVRVREGPVFEVGSADPVALWVHEGTEPHQIVGNPLLVFHWAKLGKVVAFRQVNHPGTKPNRFLVEALTVLNGR
jgi:hypothetical protein